VVRKKHPFDVACNPEFLREGSAIHDFQKPDRVVIGVASKKAESILRNIYAPLGVPIVVTDIASAEIIKHASNSFLATRISFINMISQICEKVGADVNKVAEGMGLDDRIGNKFLSAGIGFGGFCFPKDLSAFIRIAEKSGCDSRILRSALETNEEQKRSFVKKIKEHLWNLGNKEIAILGLSFKPNTDDMRFAPSIDIVSELQREGAKLKVFDPEAMAVARMILKDVAYAKDPYEAAKRADALVILTEWNEFKELNLERIKKLLKRPLIFDGRNMFDSKRMKELGFDYISVGRPVVCDGKIKP
jgi:UDPglucose 6-dehydrogenase